MAGVNQSDTDIRSPFGGLPNAVARRTFNNILSPLLLGFGLGGGRRAQRFNDRLAAGEFGGPLGSLIGDVQSFAPGIVSGAQGIGADLASRAPIAFDQLRGQISTALGDVETLRGQSGDLTGRARDLVDQAFSPIAGRALFQEAFQRGVDPLRQGLAARGLLSSGAGADVERQLGTDLAFGFAQQDQANQQNALGTLAGAIQNQLGVTQAGVPLAQAELAGLGQFGQLLQFANQLPLAAAGNLLSLLTAGVAPGIQLTQATAPVLGQESKGTSVLNCVPLGVPVLALRGDPADTEAMTLVLVPIEHLQVGHRVVSVDLDGRLVPGRVAALIERTTPPAHPLTVLTLQHTSTGQGSRLALSSTHPLGDGRLVRDLDRGELWGSFRVVAIDVDTLDEGVTRDLLIESPTGLYALGQGFLVGSTLDSRHAPRPDATNGRPKVVH